MPFEKGNKLGNRFTKDKRPSKPRGKNKIPSIVEEIKAMMADKVQIKDAEGKPKKITKKEAIANVLIRRALQGDIKALQLIVERLDGKVPETVNHNHAGEIGGTAGASVTQVTINLTPDDKG